MDRDAEILIDNIAAWIKRARLETPFLFMLESHLPLARLAGHGLYVTEPIAAGLMGLERVETLRKILFDADAVQRLKNILEKPETADDSAAGN